MYQGKFSVSRYKNISLTNLSFDSKLESCIADIFIKIIFNKRELSIYLDIILLYLSLKNSFFSNISIILLFTLNSNSLCAFCSSVSSASQLDQSSSKSLKLTGDSFGFSSFVATVIASFVKLVISLNSGSNSSFGNH